MSSIGPWLRVALGAIVLSWARGHGPSSPDSTDARVVGDYAETGFENAVDNRSFGATASRSGPDDRLGAVDSRRDSHNPDDSELLPWQRRLRHRSLVSNARGLTSSVLAAASDDGDAIEGVESAGRGKDAGRPPGNHRGTSAISREDELYRAKYGASAYNDLLRQRHREEMSVAGILPDPSQPEPRADSSVDTPSSVASGVTVRGSGGSMVQGVPVVDTVPATSDVPGSTGAESGVVPTSTGFPVGIIASPVLRFVPRAGGRVIAVEGAPITGWTIERSDTLRDPHWQTIGTTGADGAIRFDASASESGFWRVRSPVR